MNDRIMQGLGEERGGHSSRISSGAGSCHWGTELHVWRRAGATLTSTSVRLGTAGSSAPQSPAGRDARPSAQ
jgi:hypothetical protein